MSAGSSIYSVDSKELGYTPFEYWKGPKRVSWSHWQNSEGGDTRGPSRPAAAKLAAAQPLQPDHLHAAQQFVARIQAQERGANDNASYSGTVTRGQEKKKGGSQEGADKRGAVGGERHGSPPPQYAGVDRNYIYPSSSSLSEKNLFRQGRIEQLESGNSDTTDMARRFYDESAPWYDIRSWSKRRWAMWIAALLLVILLAILIPVFVIKAIKANNAYPDYSKLNYTLSETYSGTSFFDKFDYLYGEDKSLGFVHYTDPDWAKSYNLTYATADTALVKVDTSLGPTTNPDASTGRLSVRLGSKVQYNKGLFVFDIKHTPYGCGTWPALWLTDMTNWPKNGEIDVMEAVNNGTAGNTMSLHTDSGCSMDSVKRIMSGTSLQGDCNNSTNDNAGCGVSGATSSFGAAFNQAGGGIMALEWRSEGIRMWQFGRSAIPSDITSKTPDPSTWGTALADFPNTDCDMSQHFRNHSIIVNIDLCGQWAGNANVYSQYNCPSNCTDFVAKNPKAFSTAYWEFGSFQVYNS